MSVRERERDCQGIFNSSSVHVVVRAGGHWRTSYNIGQLYERISSLLDMRRWSIVTSPGGAASTKEETTSDLDMTGG